MKKFTKKNNKGFSLVELIVVILIMAIIAVALAPQVMKWVGTSGENTDKNNAATIKASVLEAVSDYIADNGKLSDTYAGKTTTFTVVEAGIKEGSNAAVKVDSAAKGDALVNYISKTMGDYPEVKGTASSVFQISLKVAASGIDATADVTIESGSYK